MDIFNDTGVVVVVVTLIIFYLRLMQLRGKKRRLEREAAVKRLNEANRKRGKVAPAPGKNPNKPPYSVASWPLIIIATIMMLFGVAARSGLDFIPLIEKFWWVPTALGVLLYVFCFKVEVE